MANTIRIKRSTTNNVPSTLANAELAFTEGTKILYYGVGSGGAGGSATTIEAIGGLGAFVSLGSTAQTIEGVKTFTGAIVLGTPGSGTLTNCTGLPVSTGVSGLGTNVPAFLATPSSANLASAITDETGSGALVFATSPTLVTPALGTPSALVGTNISGTGANFTAGAVTNAGLTGEVTTSGLAATISNSAVIGKVITGYTSGAGVVAATDTILQAIQKLNGNAIVGVADAGALTGATLASNVLASSLTSVGTLASLTVTATIVGSVNGNAATATTATNVTTNANLTGHITSTGNATVLGTAAFSSANLAGALTDETGTGSVVFATSPTLVTPALGTPSALVGTNISGTGASFTAGTVTTNANLTGHITSTGNATVLGTASFSSANLAGALTDETGSGAAVFATSPTLVTPALGTPSALVGTNISGTGASFTAGTATNATNVAITAVNDSTDYFIPLLSAATGNIGLNADAGTGANGLTYNPAVATLTTGTISATLVQATTISPSSIGGELDITIEPQDFPLTIAPTTSDPAGGTSPSLTVGYLDNAADFVTVAGGDLYLSTKTNSASAITPVNIIFEGATADGFETTLTVTDPTADRTITLPNATGTVALTTDLSQFAATSSAQLATLISDETGSGALVFATSPTLVTPALGTPSALVGTNISGTGASFTAGNVTTNANLTGHITSTGNATVLGTAAFSSANLAGALTDETGSGAAVFATSPTLVTPALGTPSALVGTNISGTGASFTAGNVTTNANLTGHITSTGNATVLGTAAFSSANLAGALTDETGSGSAVFATSPTLVTPALGTPSALVGTNISGTGASFTAGNVTTNANLTGHITSTGNATVLGTAAFSSANLAGALTDETGTGSAVFSASPTFTGTLNCAALTSTGNVTVGGDLIVNGTTTTVNSTVTTLDDPIITLGGDGNGINDDKDRGVEFKWNDGTAKVGFFGFDESTGYLTFIPEATNSSEVFSGTKGDIAATNFRGALIGNADTVTTNANLTGHITSTGNATVLGTAAFSSANLAGALTDETGTGSVVFATSPTLVTPALGTPSALVGTNISGTGASFTAGTVTTNANLTGHITSTGNATVLGTAAFSSANLAGALTDETGSGSAVFATSPTLVTPALGTPASGILTNCTGTASGLTAGLVTDGLYTTSSIDGGSY